MDLYKGNKENAPLLTGGPINNIEKQIWPPIVWFVMKISGIFYHSRIVRQRRCLSCDMDFFEKQNDIAFDSSGQIRPIEFDVGYNATSRYEGTFSCSSEENNNCTAGTRKEECLACQSCWWDKDGQVVPYTESSIGVKTWNHPGSWFLSVIILFATVGLLINEFRHTIYKMFGKPQMLLHFLSYSAFLSTVSVVPIMSLCSKMRSALGGCGPGRWATAINARFIVQRLQYLQPLSGGYPGQIFLVVALVWPVICVVFRCYVILAVQEKQTFDAFLTCAVAGLSEFIWGCFVILIFLMRLSFQIQFDLVLRFLKTMEGRTELCQRVLRQASVDFRCFSHCVRIYMTAVIPLCVLAITTNLTWQYMLYSNKHEISQGSFEVQKNINLMIWLEITMFICLAPIAVGGVDANHIWERFHMNVHCLQSSSHQKHWNEVLRFLKHIEEKSPAISFSMVLSVVGFYMAVQFGKQDVYY